MRRLRFGSEVLERYRNKKGTNIVGSVNKFAVPNRASLTCLCSQNYHA